MTNEDVNLTIPDKNTPTMRSMARLRQLDEGSGPGSHHRRLEPQPQPERRESQPQPPKSTVAHGSKNHHPGFSQSHLDHLSALLLNRQQEGKNLNDESWPSNAGLGISDLSGRPRIWGQDQVTRCETRFHQHHDYQHPSASFAAASACQGSYSPPRFSDAELPGAASPSFAAIAPASNGGKSHDVNAFGNLHDAAQNYVGYGSHKVFGDSGRRGINEDRIRSRGARRNIHSRCTKGHNYRDADDEIFDFLDKPHPTVTGNETASAATTSIQGGTAAGSGSLSAAEDPTQSVVVTSQLPNENPPPLIPRIGCRSITHGVSYTAAAGGSNSLVVSTLPPYLPPSVAAAVNKVSQSTTSSDAAPALDAARIQQCNDAPTVTATTMTSTKESSADKVNGIINSLHTSAKKKRTCSPLRSIGEQQSSTRVSLSAADPSIDGPCHARYPSSEEETDRYLRSLRTNELITLSTKAQCELQERGRSFSSILSGGIGAGAGAGVVSTRGCSNDTTATMAQGKDSRGGRGLGNYIDINLGSGRLSKEKRKHDDADIGREGHIGATTKSTLKPDQDERKKTKKQKNDEGEGEATIAPNTSHEPAATHPASFEGQWPRRDDQVVFQMRYQRDGETQRDEETAKIENADDDGDEIRQRAQQKQEGTTSKKDSVSTTVIATAAKQSLVKKDLREQVEDLDWHYVKEDCWRSPQLCCGDVFEIVDRQECS